jgi:ferredoxin
LVTEHAVSLRVHVDSEKCQGHNRCSVFAPELFDIDDMGISSEHGDGVVAPELMDQARRAVANCPEGAITMTEL